MTSPRMTAVNPMKDTWNGRDSFSGGSHITPRKTKWYRMTIGGKVSCVIERMTMISH